MNLKLSIILPLMVTISTCFAGSVTGDMKTNATISSTCAVSTTNLPFGTYNPNAGDYLSTGNINIICTKGTSVTVGLNVNLAANNGGTPVSSSTPYGAVYTTDGQTWSRYMTNGSNELLYNFFQDAAHTKVFGGTNFYPGQSGVQETITATGAIQSIPFYAAMGGGQYVVPGSYSDTAIAVLTY